MNLIPKFLRRDKLVGYVPFVPPDRETEFDIENEDVVAVQRNRSDTAIVVRNPASLHGHTTFHLNCSIEKHREFVRRFRNKIGASSL